MGENMKTLIGQRKHSKVRAKVPKGTPCGYCFSNWASGWDHLIPRSYKADHKVPNLHPSCLRCNNLLGNTMFDSIEEKMKYVRSKLIALGEWSEPERFDIDGNPLQPMPPGHVE